MPEISYIAPLPRAELRAVLRRSHGALDPSLRILAEDLLGAGSNIDLVAADAAGRVALILIGDEGGDRELFTRAIAQRAWVTARLRDWTQLAPSLGLDIDAPVRLSLLCPSYAAETLAAAAALGPDFMELSVVRYKAVRTALFKTRFLLALVLLVPLARYMRPEWGPAALGISLFGQLIQTWCFASLVKNRELSVRGPYKLVRNPMYLGRYFLIFGFVCLLESLVAIVIYTGLVPGGLGRAQQLVGTALLVDANR